MAKRFFFLAVAMCALAGIAQADSNSLTGKWKLNPAASSLSDQMKVRSEGGNKYSFIFSGDNVEEVAVDGTEQPGLYGTTLTVTPEDAEHWKVVRKKDGRIQIVGKWTLSSDGKTLTDEFTSYRPDGVALNLHYVYTREGKGKGFAGTWISTTEQVNSSYEIELAPYQNDGITLRYPTFDLTKSANFDGKDYPTSGANSVKGETVSARRLNEHGFEMKDKVNGKVIATSRFVISPDGNTLRVMVMSPGKDTPNVMVFERE